MKNMLILILSIVILRTLAACGGSISDNDAPRKEPFKPSGISQIESTPDLSIVTNNDTSDEPIQNENDENSMTNISITVGDSVFTAKLHDNETAREFAARLPMSLNMSELNGNEKYYNLPDRLPADSERLESINSGDLMLYGSDCLVLFYESFSTSYNYTKLGIIEDASGLSAALGSGNVEVAFAVID